jgi:hypothetical protein
MRSWLPWCPAEGAGQLTRLLECGAAIFETCLVVVVRASTHEFPWLNSLYFTLYYIAMPLYSRTTCKLYFSSLLTSLLFLERQKAVLLPLICRAACMEILLPATVAVEVKVHCPCHCRCGGEGALPLPLSLWR